MISRLRTGSWRQAAQRCRLFLDNRPIILGPFTSEVGFEVFYWEPWIRALGLPVDRLYPLTRGGASAWYTTRPVTDLYDLRTPKEVRIETRIRQIRTGLLKQMAISPWDRAVIRDFAKQHDLSTYHVIHPSTMFRDLAPYWVGQRGLRWVNQRLTFTRLNEQGQDLYTSLQVPPLPEGLTLPKNFIAVKFYGRITLPMSPPMVEWSHAILKQLADQGPVVVLDTGFHADDHADYPVPDHPNIHRIAPSCTPTNNLAVISAVLARANAFVGTFGAIAQLAVHYRVPSVSFYAQWTGTTIQHKHLSDWLASQLGVPFVVLPMQASNLLMASLVRIASGRSSRKTS
jgi:hypothetical protein